MGSIHCLMSARFNPTTRGINCLSKRGSAMSLDCYVACFAPLSACLALSSAMQSYTQSCIAPALLRWACTFSQCHTPILSTNHPNAMLTWPNQVSCHSWVYTQCQMCQYIAHRCHYLHGNDNHIISISQPF